VLVAGACAVATAALLHRVPTSGPRAAVAGLAVPAAIAAAVAVGTWVHRPQRRVVWLLVGLGTVAWSVGAVWQAVAPQGGAALGAAVAQLAGYLLLAVALVRTTTGHGVAGVLSGVLDALCLTLVVALVPGVLVALPAWQAAGRGPSVLALAHATGAMLLTFSAAFVAVQHPRRGRAGRRMGVAVLLLATAALLGPALPPGARHLGAAHVLALCAAVLVASSALHPSMATVAARHQGSTDTFSLARVLALGAAFGALPGLSIVLWLLGRPHPTFWVQLVDGLLVVLVVVRLVEVAATMRTQRARLARLADTDFLTGLDNRRRFQARVAEQLASARPRAAVLMVGLQRFAEINDTLGYRTGDELLRTVGLELGDLLASDGAVARVGGDVFGVVLPGAGPAAAQQLARRVRELLVEPIAVSGMSITVDGAVGIVVLPDDEADPDLVLERGDVALAAAAQCAAGVARYTREVEETIGSAPRLMAELKDALDAGDVVVHFQPQVEVATGKVIGAESLVRWRHPTRGLISPADFVPAAERTGLVRLLTLVVLDRAVAQGAAWHAEGRQLTIAVNLSVRNLLDARLVDDVRSSLERHGLPASLLELEITETMAMVDPVRAAAVLSNLADLGVVLSVDDYGTGYGSLAYLQRLPVRRLKIDRSFVTGLLDDPASAAIVHSTVDLARHLGLDVVAEGVEDVDTLLALRDMRCYAAQGYGLSRPVAATQLAECITRIESYLPPLLGPALPHQRVEPASPPAERAVPVATTAR
jgi:diguanylate cyclase (GGDEF)-like protein